MLSLPTVFLDVIISFSPGEGKICFDSRAYSVSDLNDSRLVVGIDDLKKHQHDDIFSSRSEALEVCFLNLDFVT